MGPPPRGRWIDDTATSGSKPCGLSAECAFSINVAEHASDLESFVDGGAPQLEDQEFFRLFFPNYVWPYESHFNAPTLLNKRLTERLLLGPIMRLGMKDAEVRLDPVALWDGLSCPARPGVDRTLRAAGYEPNFSHSATDAYLTWALSDAEFASRKGQILSRSTRLLGPTIESFSKLINARFLPVLDLTVLPVSPPQSLFGPSRS